MYDNDEYADVTLTCENKSIKCQRGILGMYSPVIQKMLTSGFQETKTNEIQFSDISFAHLRKAVRFLYGYELEITSRDVIHLLQFADMYDIGPLRELCGKMLMKHINTAVAMEVWMLAHRYNSPTFYTEASNYCANVFINARRTREYI